MCVPMRLEFDAGNTLVKWRLLDLKGRIQDRGEFDSTNDAGEVMARHDFLDKVTGVLISSVSSTKLEASVRKLLGSHLSSEQFFVARPLAQLCGVRFAYTDISRLGVDRCLAMIAAYKDFPDGVLVIDCGSAITADILSAQGVHVGGYILPGFRLLKECLLRGTANIRINQTVATNVTPGQSTEECVQHGIYLMISASLMSLRDIASRLGVSSVIVTGGDGQLAISLIDYPATYSRDLVFEGLGMLCPF